VTARTIAIQDTEKRFLSPTEFSHLPNTDNRPWDPSDVDTMWARRIRDRDQGRWLNEKTQRREASVAFERPKRSGPTVRCIAHDEREARCLGYVYAYAYASLRFARRGRYWDRASDLCSVNVSHHRLALPQKWGDTATDPARCGFSALIALRYLSVVFGVMWTRCGRENPLQAFRGYGRSRSEQLLFTRCS
jgi:hypothetical protein